MTIHPTTDDIGRRFMLTTGLRYGRIKGIVGDMIEVTFDNDPVGRLISPASCMWTATMPGDAPPPQKAAEPDEDDDDGPGLVTAGIVVGEVLSSLFGGDDEEQSASTNDFSGGGGDFGGGGSTGDW